jgi:hypothetical protein
MMSYSFDEYGWISTTTIEGRTTDVAPPSDELQAGFNWNFTGYEWVQQELNPIQLVPIEQPRKITRLAFLNRFTDTEAITIDLASIGATPQAAAMRRHMSKVNNAEYIDLKRQDTRDGVQLMEAVGILASGRALIILDSPIQESEKFVK